MDDFEVDDDLYFDDDYVYVDESYDLAVRPPRNKKQATIVEINTRANSQHRMSSPRPPYLTLHTSTASKMIGMTTTTMTTGWT